MWVITNIDEHPKVVGPDSRYTEVLRTASCDSLI